MTYVHSLPCTNIPRALSTCGEAGLDMHALIKESGVAQLGDSHRRVSASGEGDGKGPPPAAVFVRFTADAIIPNVAPSLQTGGGACR